MIIKEKIRFLVAIILLLSPVVSCAEAGVSSKAVPGKVESPVASATAKPAWETQWDQLVEGARQEGRVVIYGATIAPIVAALREPFKQRFGIDLDLVSGGGAEIVAKIDAERRAGLYLVDVGHMGEPTLMTRIKPAGITVPLPGLLILPEVTNPANWAGGQFPFMDKDLHNLRFISYASPPIMINTDLVKEGEIASFPDLLKPQWKGKIVMSDPDFSSPAVSGGTGVYLTALLRFYGEDRTRELFRQLAAQEPVISRNERLLIEWVARGKSSAGIGMIPAVYNEFKAAGSPIQYVRMKEPAAVTGGPGNLSVFSRNPHPKATQLYINWLLSKEGLTIWSKASLSPSARLDVSKEGLDPLFFARDDDYSPSEDFFQLRRKVREIGAGIFLPLLK